MLTDVINRAYETGMLQKRAELQPFCEWLKHFHIRNFCEIGVWHGASFSVWDAISQPGLHIGIDPNNQHGIILTPEQLVARAQLFNSLQPTVYMLMVDSKKNSTVNAVAAILGTQQLDFLFIDGDHSQHACHHDYVRYSRFVRPGGVIALHDIALYPGCKRVWRDIRIHLLERLQFIDTETPSGIGAIVTR